MTAALSRKWGVTVKTWGRVEGEDARREMNAV